MIKITHDDIKIQVKAEKEHDSLKLAAKECAPGFEESVKRMLAKSKTWGWCCVEVIVSLKEGPTSITGNAYLGHCSYSSKEDFIENSGYYQQMVDDAIVDLSGNLKSHTEELAKSIAEFNKFDETISQSAKILDEIEFQLA